VERKWWALPAVCMGTFMLLLDITVVDTALICASAVALAIRCAAPIRASGFPARRQSA
jgi:hypothetical protein